MGYLMPAQYQAYGLPPDTPDDFVTTASALIEAHCRRPTLFAAPYTERVRLVSGSQTIRLSYGPLLDGALISGRVRYAQPRRGESYDNGIHPESNALFIQQVATAFGLPGAWSALDITTVDLYPGPRVVTLPANFLGIPCNEVELTYTAGFVTIPDQVAVACAQVVKNAQAIPAMNIKTTRMDTLQMEYFSADLIDPGTAALLQPYRAERLG